MTGAAATRLSWDEWNEVVDSGRQGRILSVEQGGTSPGIEDARIEDRDHFEALVPRIYGLGGELPRDVRGFADVAGCPVHKPRQV